MKHLNISLVLAFLLVLVSCKPDPAVEKINYNRTENSVAVRLEADVANLNPLLASSRYESQIFSDLYTYLCSYDFTSNDFVPELLKAVPTIEENSEAGLPGNYTIQCEILDEAIWPNGSPVTGNDLLFTIKALMNPLVEAARYRAPFGSTPLVDIIVDETNPKVFTFYIEDKTIQDLEVLTNMLPVLPAYLLDPEGRMENIELSDLLDPDKADNLAASNEDMQAFAQTFMDPEFSKDIASLSGSGPYEIVDWVTAQRVTLQRKSDWWGDKVSKETHPTLIAYPEEIVFIPIADPTAALTALKSEEIDVMSRVDPGAFEALKEDSIAGQRYQLEAVSSSVVYMMSVNTNVPKLADPLVRNAIAHAINIDEVLESIYLGYGERTASPVHPTQDYYNGDLSIIRQNVEKAKALLTEAGWEDSNNNGIVDKEIEGELVDLSIELIVSPAETAKNAGLLYQDQARQAGINLEVNSLDTRTYLSRWRAKDFEMISAGSTITPIWIPLQKWHTGSGDNRTGFGNAETDALIDEIIVTLDEEKRNELYKKLQKDIYDQQAWIYLFNPRTTVAIHNRFDAPLLRDFPCYAARTFKLQEDFQVN